MVPRFGQELGVIAEEDLAAHLARNRVSILLAMPRDGTFYESRLPEAASA
ncbi:hypothetical protein ACH4CE_26170 [Streptomyces gelaticus]